MADATYKGSTLHLDPNRYEIVKVRRNTFS